MKQKALMSSWWVRQLGWAGLQRLRPTTIGGTTHLHRTTTHAITGNLIALLGLPLYAGQDWSCDTSRAPPPPPSVQVTKATPRHFTTQP